MGMGFNTPLATTNGQSTILQTNVHNECAQSYCFILYITIEIIKKVNKRQHLYNDGNQLIK